MSEGKWEELSNQNIDLKRSKEPVEGTYSGHKDITTKIGPQVVWLFDTAEGQVGIYGFTNLNRIMETCKVGWPLKITYRGTKNVKTNFGMKDVHQVSVERWNDGKQSQTNELPDFDGGAEAPPLPSDNDIPF